jgi:hypothetical protein
VAVIDDVCLAWPCSKLPLPASYEGRPRQCTVTYSKIQFHWGDTWPGDILSGEVAKPDPLDMERR